jgi:hypothetical protein
MGRTHLTICWRKAGMANTGQKPDHSYNNILQALRELQMSSVITNSKLQMSSVITNFKSQMSSYKF